MFIVKERTTMADNFEIIEGTLRKYTGDEAVVTVPEGVIRLECGFCFENPFVREVWISSTVQFIGSKAFADCYELTKIYIPDSVREIAPDCFLYSSNVEIIASDRWKRKHWRCHPSLKQYAPWWRKLFCRQ